MSVQDPRLSLLDMQRAVYRLLHVHLFFTMFGGTALRGVSKVSQAELS